MKTIELESPERFGITILPKTAEIQRKDGYFLICSFQTGKLYLIQEIASALEHQKIKCDISSYTNPENGSNIYNLWGKAKFSFEVRFVEKHHGLTW
jgi:hypothetical protein